jgi:outer membrane protein TolC
VRIFLALLFAFSIAHANEEDVTFSRALSEMVASDVDVRVQQTNVSASEAQLLAARGAFFPTLSLQAQQQNSGGFNSTNSLPQGQVYSAVANWNVFRAGSDSAGLTAAVSNRDQKKLSYEDTHLQAEGKAATALLNMIRDQLRIEVLKRSEENAQKFLAIAKSRYEMSLLAKEEMDKIAIDESNAESRRADAEVQFHLSRATVESLLGHSHVRLEWPWEKKLSAESVKTILDAAPKGALDSRPDYRAAKATLETEEARSRSSFRNLFPTIDLNFTESQVQLAGQSSNAWQGLATLTIPLWNGYKDYSNYRVQTETKNAAEFRLHQMERDIDGAVRTVQDNFKVAVQQYQSRLKNLNLAKHLLEQDAARFKIGRVDANELNLDLGRVTDAELLALDGISQAHLALMNLQHAFGQPVE